jgi:glyoxylase-like metal-dependent hydrolase (beta-lactamase superfamily II)
MGTCRHHDHTGGMASVHEAFPSAKFWQFQPAEIADTTANAQTNKIDSSSVAPCDCSTSKASIADAAEKGTQASTTLRVLPLEDGQLFPVSAGDDTTDFSLRIVHCPGHTSDHVAVILEPAPPGETHPVLFSGDCILGQGSAVFESLSEYLNSLQRLHDSFDEEHDCVIYPAHGPVVPNGKAKIKQYIEHRMLREKQIVGVLQRHPHQGGMSAMDIVEVVYKEQHLSELLTKAACQSVLLHLRKLKVDGVASVVDASLSNSNEQVEIKDQDKRWHLLDTATANPLKAGML